MPRSKVKFEDLKASFEKASVHLSEDASILPMKGDDTKVLFTSEGQAVSYTCSSLKGHLEFLTTALS